MDKTMQEIINGALLGDGCVSKSKESVNYLFTYSSKSYQHVDYVCNLFKEYSSGEYISKRDRYDKRTDKTYTTYQYNSVHSPTFTSIYKDWYKDGIKIIPENIELTSLTCLIWYLGDGSLINVSGTTNRLMLYTNCFQKNDLENILISKLAKFNPHLIKMNSNKDDGTGYAIAITKQQDILNFLNYIGSCPFPDYAYKWNFNGFHGKKLWEYVDEWKKLSMAGISISLISKAYNCSKTQIDNYYKKYNIHSNKIIDRLYRWMIDYNKGKSIDIIAEESNCTKESVNKIINYVLDNPNEFDFSKKKGVSSGKKWNAYITVNYKHIYLGEFDNYEDAVNARIKGEDIEYEEWLKEQGVNNERNNA